LDLARLSGPVPGGLIVNLLAASTLLAGGLVLGLGHPAGPGSGLRRGLVVALGSTVVLTVSLAGGAVLAGWPADRPVAFALGAAALALLLLLTPPVTRRQCLLAQGCALLPALPASLAVCEFLFDARAHRPVDLAPDAPGAVVLSSLLLAAGIFFARPDPGTWAGFVRSGTATARITRRLLLAGLLLPVLSVAAKRLILAAGWSLETHLGFSAWLQMIVLCSLAAGFGWVLHRSETRRERAEAERRDALRHVERQAAIMQSEVARRTGELSRALLFNQRLALVAERTTNSVLITNPAGEIEWVNAGFSRITGYAFEDVLGRKPGHLLQGPRTNPETVAAIRDLLAAGRGFEAELLNYHREGREYWAAVEVQPLRDAGGKLVGFMGIESDITTRKLAEGKVRAARHEAERLNARLEQARIEGEIEAITDHAKRAMGKGGRARQVHDLRKRQRDAVRNNLARTLAEITKHESVLGAHLRKTIKLGSTSAYFPDTDVAWVAVPRARLSA